MRFVGHWTLLLLAVSLCSCGKWPPYEEELVEKFDSSRESFWALESKLKASKYFRVSQTGIWGIPRFKDSYEVVAEIHGDEFVESETIEDDREWEEHFRKAGLFSVEYYEDIVILGFVGQLPVKNRWVWADYVHSAEHRTELRPCLDEHKKLACGICVVDLAEEWFIRYRWTPEEQVPGGFDRVLEGEITEEEYDELFDKNLRQCRKDGYSAIGYDTSRWDN